MKKNFSQLLLLLTLLLLLQGKEATAQTSPQTTTLLTYYTAPRGNYFYLKLWPWDSNITTPCAVGTLAMKSSPENRVYFCSDTGSGQNNGTWGLMPGVWKETCTSAPGGFV